MNTHPFDALPLDQQGAALILTPCPGSKGVDTALALEQLQAGGADALITLMPDTELASNAVTDIGQRCAARGLQWFHLPIEDDHAPEEDFATAWEAQRLAVHQLLDAGGKIAIHCKGGSGRTGLLAAQILVERGLSKSEAVAMVKAVRPNALSLAVHQNYLSGLCVGQPARERSAPK
jgi:protein-tyrosine phosphatase